MVCHSCNSNKNLVKFKKGDVTHSTLVRYEEDGVYCCTSCYKKKNAMTRFALLNKKKLSSLYGF